MSTMEVLNRNSLPFLLRELGINRPIIAELGVAAGDYSDILLRSVPDSLVYSVDRWTDHHGEAEFRSVVERFAEYGPRSIIVRGSFQDVRPQFDDESLDMVYVDGYAHTGQEGGRTLDEWWSAVRPGGIFGGHDYDLAWPATIIAVDRFAAKHGIPISTTKTDRYQSWWTVKAAQDE